MTKKLHIATLAMLASLLSCSDLNKEVVGLSSDSQQGLSSSSIGGEYSSQSLLSELAPSSSDGTQLLSSSSNGQVIPSSSSQVTDPNVYEKLTTSNAQKGWGSRYWDACKPHCSQRDNVDTNANPFKVCRNCDINGTEIPAFTLSPNVSQYWTGYEGTKSSCDGGPAYACMDMAPMTVNDTLAYAYVATSKTNAQCGQCFQIQFDGGGHYGTKAAHKLIAGKTLIAIVSNTGTDVEAGQFDIMIPGGGVGIYDALSKQVGVAKSALGEQYGGFLTTCQKELNSWDLPAAKYEDCVRNKCQAVFGGNEKFAHLMRGCNWFVDWLHAADNPTYLVKPVACPAYLSGGYPSTINTSKSTSITANGY